MRKLWHTNKLKTGQGEGGEGYQFDEITYAKRKGERRGYPKCALNAHVCTREKGRKRMGVEKLVMRWVCTKWMVPNLKESTFFILKLSSNHVVVEIWTWLSFYRFVFANIFFFLTCNFGDTHCQNTLLSSLVIIFK